MVFNQLEINFDFRSDAVQLSTDYKQIPTCSYSYPFLHNTFSFISGVPVIGYNTEIFPAFFTNNSGIPSPMNVSKPEIIADMLLSQLKLGLNNGENYVHVVQLVYVYVCVCV